MKSAIIGCGAIAAVHAKALELLDGCQLTAVADMVPAQAEQMAKMYQATVYSDWEQMLETEDIDVVHICTPHSLHTPMAVAALKKGIHVFMEKPPVTSWLQWEQLQQAEKEAASGAKLGICFQNRFNPSVVMIKERMQAGEFGAVKGARGLVTWCRNADYYTESSWRGTWEQECGGALINQSIHTMDLIQYLMGKKPQQIEAAISNHHLKGVIQVEDTMEAYISYGKERACFYATTAYVTNAAPIIEFECEKARIRMEDLKVTITANGEEEVVDYTGRAHLGKSYWGTGHMDCIRSFYESIEQGSHFPIGLVEIEDTVWLLLKAYDSARKTNEGTEK